MDSNTLEILIRLKDHLSKEIKGIQNNVNSSMKGVDSSIQASAKNTKGFVSSIKEMGSTALGVAGGMGLFALTSSIVDYTKTAVMAGFETARFYENAQIGFTTLLGDAQAATKAIDQIKKDALATPLDARALVEGSKLLISTGMSAETARKDILNLGKAIVATGGGNAELSRMAVNLQQIKNVGKATALDIKQFAFAGVNIYQLLADATGKNVEEVKDLEVSYELLSEALAKAGEDGGKFSMAFENAGGSMEQVVSNTQEAIGNFFAEVWQMTGAYDAVKVVLLGLQTTMNDSLPSIQSLIVGARELASALGTEFNSAIDAARNKISEYAYILDAIKGYADEVAASFGALGERIYDELNFDTSNIGILDFFGQLTNEIWPALDEVLKQIGQGFTNAFSMFGEGGGAGGFMDFLGTIGGLILQVVPIITNSLTPVFNQFMESLRASKPMFDQLLQQIGPLLVNALTVLVGIVAIVGTVFLAVFSGIMQAISFALPFIIQVFTGLAQFLNGIMMIIVGIFTLNFGMVWEGIKTTFQGIFNTIVGALGAVLAFVAGFVTGVIEFFKTMYMTLVGGSIVPDMVNEIVTWITSLGTQFMNIVSNLISSVIRFFEQMRQQAVSSIVAMSTNVISSIVNLWNRIVSEVSQWPGRMMQWGKKLIQSFIDGIKSMAGAVGSAIKGVLDGARAMLEGHSPPVEGPLKNIDVWGANVGQAWVDGFAQSLSGLGSAMQSPLAYAGYGMDTGPGRAGSTVTNNTKYDQPININVYPKDELDMATVAYQLAYKLRNE